MKKASFVLFLFLIFINLHASHVAFSDAKKAAVLFLMKQTQRGSGISFSDITEEQYEGTTCYYVFNFSGGGFVMMAADDAVTPVLGYSTQGRYDKNNIPPAAQFLYHEYCRQIKTIIDTRVVCHANKQKWDDLLSGFSVKGVKSVTPLCLTTWGQGCYYNALCPADANGSCGHAVTGCVATSMAQIMKKWNYPPRGTGSHTYVHPTYGTLSADFGNTVYPWGAMPGHLTSANTPVATLMYHCGVSLEMNYGASGSASSIKKEPLIQYFRYSPNVHDFSIYTADDSTRISVMKRELDGGRPMWVAGSQNYTYHAFVCDGYDENDLFHFNYGWGGSSDGYYTVSNLIPGPAGSYTTHLIALIGIMPLMPGDIAVKSLAAPDVTATFTGPEPVRVRIANYDTIAHTGIPVTLFVDNIQVVSDVITSTILPSSEIIYEFSQQYDFSTLPGHVFNVKVITSYTPDSYSENDTLVTPVENVICANTPYFMNFTENDDYYRWKISDLNADSITWTVEPTHPQANLDPGFVRFGGSTTSDANDWLISKCLSLESSKTYKLTFWYQTFVASCPQKLRVKIGNRQLPDSLNTLLLDLQNITNENFQKADINFTVPAGGSYYIGWQCYSNAHMYSMKIDNIAIIESDYADIGITSVVSPADGCSSDDSQITAVLRNYGATTATNFPVSYTVNNSIPVTETFTGLINPGEQSVYTFSTPAPLLANGLYHIKIKTMLADDNGANDSVDFAFTNNIYLQPFSMGFESGENLGGWSVFNPSNNYAAWALSTSGGHFAPYCYKHSWNTIFAANDWLISNCMYLQTGTYYKLSYWYKAGSSVYPEKMKVCFGNTPDETSLTNLLIDHTNIVNQDYIKEEVVFTVPATDIYFIGWKCYSDVNMYLLFLDDIQIQNISALVNENPDNEQQIHLYPNPFGDMLQIQSSGFIHNIQIYGVNGQMIYQQDDETLNPVLNLGFLSPGMYCLIIRTDSGTCVKRIVKE